MTTTSRRRDGAGLRKQWRRAWSSRQSGKEALSLSMRRDLEANYGDLSHLRSVGIRPPLREYVTELWDRRHFIWAGARGEALTRYSSERLGMGWFILRPILDAAFYGIIFGLLLRMSDFTDNFVAFIIIGVFMFRQTAHAINGGSSLIRSSKAMIRAFAFPRASLAMSMVVREVLVGIPAIGVMIVAIIAIPPHELPTVAWSLFPVLLMLQVTLNLGLALAFGWLGALLPDVAQAMSFLTRLMMYGSAVIFPIERFVEDPTALAIIKSNPLYILLDMYRTVLIDGAVPTPAAWMQALLWAIGMLLVGFLLFWWNEDRYGRE